MRAHTTPTDSSFGTYCVAVFTEEYIREIAELRKQFLAFKEKHGHVHEWVMWTPHTEFFSQGTEMAEMADGWKSFLPCVEEGEDLGDIELEDIFVLSTSKDKDGNDVEPSIVKMPDVFEFLGKPDRTEMEMIHIDERGIQFSCFIDNDDDFSKTVEIPYSFLFEGRL